MIWASERRSASSSTTRIVAMPIDPCETEARRNRREITWLGRRAPTKCRKVSTPLSIVGPRQRDTTSPHLLSRAPSRHHDASTRLLSIGPVPEGVCSLDAEHPERVWCATQHARSPLPVKEAGHGSASPPTDWGLFSGPSSLTADESWVIGEGGYETG